MTSLVRTSNTYQKENATIRSSASQRSLIKGLTVDEIFGNIFVINSVGYDTTRSN